jgi:hypothetical protein
MDGLKTAVLYSLYFEDNPSVHHNYKQLKHSISSIRKFSDIDIFVYISSKTKIIDQFFIDNKVILIDFNNDEVFKRWSNKVPVHPWNIWLHHRWINILNFIKQHEYDRVLFLDTDTIFYKSPIELLNKYNKDMCYFKKEFNDGVVQNFIKSLNINPGINDGQMILSKTEINKILKDFELLWIDTINNFTDKIFSSLNSNTDHIFFWNVSQYAAYYNIRQSNIKYEYFEDKDICLGTDFDTTNKDDVFIHHYFSGNMKRYINE